MPGHPKPTFSLVAHSCELLQGLLILRPETGCAARFPPSLRQCCAPSETVNKQ